MALHIVSYFGAGWLLDNQSQHKVAYKLRNIVHVPCMRYIVIANTEIINEYVPMIAEKGVIRVLRAEKLVQAPPPLPRKEGLPQLVTSRYGFRRSPEDPVSYYVHPYCGLLELCFRRPNVIKCPA